MSRPSKSSMVNGQVGMMESDSLWNKLGGSKMLAKVELSGKPSHVLEFYRTFNGKMVSYRLLGILGNEVTKWEFTRSWMTQTLDLNSFRGNEAFKLEYKINMFGGRYFVTREGKKRIYMELTDHSRSFVLDGMMFKHIDFQSHIYFRCDKRRVNQAILIASLIFTPPMSTEATG